jgi:hypothetical protein
MSEFSSIAQFHEFVLEGNDKALEVLQKPSAESRAWG